MMRSGAIFAVFLATLVLVVRRPWRVGEAWWACAGALAMLALGAVGPSDVADVLVSAKNPLLFLVALLVLAALLERSGFFEWAAILAARRARGDARVLYRNVFLLGALVTALLSLDTTAVILTPIVLAFALRLGLPARPYVFACALVANTASLPLPISNLTNLLFADAFHISFAAFAARMLLPQLAALAATFAAARWIFRAELPTSFAVDRLPDAASVVPHRGFFRAAVAAIALVCAGYFVAPLAGVAPYVPAFLAAAALAIVGAVAGRVRIADLTKNVGWAVVPFVVGLFVVVRAVEGAGARQWAVAGLEGVAGHPWLALPAVVAGTAVASNLVNNLPAALLALGALQAVHAPSVLVYGALLGTNVGPSVMTSGSLATMLVLARARARGEHVGGLDVVRVGLFVTPLALLAATIALAIEAGR